MKEKLGDLLVHLWVAIRIDIVLLVCTLSTKREIVSWNKAIYALCIHPKSVPALGSLGNIKGPSDMTLGTLTNTLIQVKSAIKD